MSKVSVSLPQGTRDFGPEVVHKRNYIFNIIRSVFELYGFQPLETPAMENLETLMGKYGEEGDRLIFKILKNGDLIKDIPLNKLYEDSINSFKEYASSKEDFILSIRKTLKLLPPSEKPSQNLEIIDLVRDLFKKYLKDNYLTERALRYDLTIPFARYVAMNHNKLVMPFKRYQMQPVWRADRPQRGRYREFYQCDADVVGSKSLLNEVDFVSIYQKTFNVLKIPVQIKINNRKLLAALAELCGGNSYLIDITIAIDKLDKVGIRGVEEELINRGLDPNQIEIVRSYLFISEFSNDNKTTLSKLNDLFRNSSIALEGLKDLNEIIDTITTSISQDQKIDLFVDPTLARGLNYYTGTIFEVKAVGVQMGSIGGGGRYDDLTGLFGVPNVPGVGISFGVDRIYDVMDELKLFPDEVQTGTQVLFFNLGKKESQKAFELAQQLRSQGIRSELYPENIKFDKQFKYAEKKAIPYVVILGTQELEGGTVNVKDIRKGEQISVQQAELLQFKFL